MFAFFIRRLVTLVPTLVFVSMLIFGLQQLLPGDPAQILAVKQDVLRADTVADGRWQAKLPIAALAESREPHQVLAWQDSTASASAPQAFIVQRNWQTVLERTDPRGDDHGRSGGLRYPADVSWGEHRQGDIESVRVQRVRHPGAHETAAIEIQPPGVERTGATFIAFHRRQQYGQALCVPQPPFYG